MLYKNVASQKMHVYAYDATTGLPKTGDADNITAYVSLDGTANAIDDTNPAEVDATNMPGIYAFDLTQAETNCNSFALYAKSATSNIRIEPIIGFTTKLAVDANGKVAVPDTQRVDINTIKTQTVTCGAGVTIHPAVGADYKIGVASDGDITKVNSLDGITAANLGKLEDILDGTGAPVVFSKVSIIAADANGALRITNALGNAIFASTDVGDRAVIQATHNSAIAGDVIKLTAAGGSGINGTLSSSATASIWAALTSAMSTAGSVGKKLADWILGSDNMVKVSADAHASGQTVKAVTDAVVTDTASRAASKNTASEIRAAVGLATANLDTQLGAKATSDELAAVQTHGDSTWATATGFATSSALAAAVTKIDTIDGNVDAILEDTSTTLPDAIEAIESGSGVTATEVRIEMDANSTKLASIKARTDLITSIGKIEVIGPVPSSGELLITAGDCYLSDYGREIKFTNDGSFGDLTNLTPYLMIRDKKTEKVVLEVAGNIEGATDDPDYVWFEPTSEHTSALFNLLEKAHQYKVEVRDDSGCVFKILAGDDCTVLW